MIGKNRESILLAIAVTITLIWAITIIVQTILPDHKAPTGITQVMIVVATAFFGGTVVTNFRKKSDADGT